jgi:hypothetical protein
VAGATRREGEFAVARATRAAAARSLEAAAADAAAAREGAAEAWAGAKVLKASLAARDRALVNQHFAASRVETEILRLRGEVVALRAAGAA